MQNVTTISEVRQILHEVRRSGKSIGCVPTMGALHEGHLSLIKAAVEQSDYVVVTIFVNPTQFAPHEDLSKYPRPLERDLKLCTEAGASLVFHPSAEEMYGQETQISVSVGSLADCWEGASRPGHFDGVATVVTKLFNVVQPDLAFFGAKDYQQQSIIRAMCRDLDFPVKIVTCPTIREESGLALSSRNVYLSDQEREIAIHISQALLRAKERYPDADWSLEQLRKTLRQELNETAGLELDYATIVDPVTLQEVPEKQEIMVALIAARVGTTRLIDNLEMSLRS
ncbi:pantoate--beta-alanine ligase [Rubinisphaera sp.]|uniref:pantoate--beta-alanine ligase n=1 Tax=Rubinisphaera sp. TaxID=2024857 RepID=UPI000C0F5006|nr:pantoate--beta-alanine ligase [Rubinisphaera sp.]MBV08990.1 pantoate--beta-alanine ligase [Rubinisphaera sp.]HCS53020.1 pantoate--beta-alanine ligase [Planctomycetaceae bacterium]|tara:strand:- start:2929 stop:3780 length:852 start_codon:yes stop_codon:yes gene_type:complete